MTQNGAETGYCDESDPGTSLSSDEVSVAISEMEASLLADDSKTSYRRSADYSHLTTTELIRLVGFVTEIRKVTNLAIFFTLAAMPGKELGYYDA